MQVNLNSVRVFCVAAKHLNFRLAAEELHRTHGAVAQQVRLLEEQLGVTLFERLPRGLALTTEGKAYYQECRKAIHRIDQVTASLWLPNGQLRLSVPPSLASRWLVSLLPEFSSTYPDIDIQLSATDKLVELAQGEADVAIRIASDTTDQDLCYEFLAPMQLCMVASPDYIIDGDTAKPEVIAQQRLIEDSHPSWQLYFDQYDLPMPKTAMAFNQTTLAIDAAANGMGIALTPKLYAEKELASNRLVVLDELGDSGPYAFYLVYPRNSNLNASLRGKFADWLRTQIVAHID